MSVHQKNGGELMNIRCDFFFILSLLLHAPPVGSLSELRNAPGYFKGTNMNFLTLYPPKYMGRLLPQMKDMSTNRSQRVRRQAGRGGSGKSIT